MPSKQIELGRAEERFRRAFERLKAGEPTVVPKGTAVSQNNVAREAGCTDPGALKKSRYPALIREIQAYVELHPVEESLVRKEAKERRNARRSLTEELVEARQQRDLAQSIVVSANRRVVELTELSRDLQQELDELRPPPTPLPKRTK